ncbi:hypothetical protein [Hydrocarboniclastica marina]|uniref:Uncharacterized protein n=1 Tax=Hydrocarboniclastica marina TaxID=2259620 RepID=A0A4P7XLN7_9ALTE|nr:hypothetical protein [Hydrocarboniclastica marina]QCF28091.1 hypothetical protein soil367_18635 [Hydrocarboniclastica marina]
MNGNCSNRAIVIGEMAEEIGGAQAISYLPAGYDGACSIVVGLDTERTVAVMPNTTEGRRVALYAIRPEGYATSAYVFPSSGSDVTHQTLEDWI